MTDTMSRPAEVTTCPACQHPLAVMRGARWCPECEWNLGEYDPERHGRCAELASYYTRAPAGIGAIR
ncbi:MAG TPA: hypothetical protein VIL37_14985 [Natronosporangium sp.]